MCTPNEPTEEKWEGWSLEDEEEEDEWGLSDWFGLDERDDTDDLDDGLIDYPDYDFLD